MPALLNVTYNKTSGKEITTMENNKQTYYVHADINHYNDTTRSYKENVSTTDMVNYSAS
jgi:hypothetical protein